MKVILDTRPKDVERAEDVEQGVEPSFGDVLDRELAVEGVQDLLEQSRKVGFEFSFDSSRDGFDELDDGDLDC